MNIFGYFLISSFIGMFLLFYFWMRITRELQMMQQSVYDPKRYLRFIKENSWRYIAFNELILILTLPLYPNHKLIMLLLIVFFTFYNMRFFTISAKRFDVKLKLNVTSRVKRQIATIVILLICFVGLLVYFKLPINHIIIISTYISPLFVILAVVINQPMEKHIQNKFKQQAITKINSHPNLSVIGITGSYGKTSIKNIINDITSEFVPTLPTPASFNTPNGLCITINQQLSPLHKVFIGEMGAYYPGEIKELCDLINPQIGIVSSIGPQHLETFKTIENIQLTKMELVENLRPDGVAILNYDNQLIRDYKIVRQDVKVLTYGMDRDDYDLVGTDVTYGFGTMEFNLFDNQTKKNYHIVTKLLGKHNLYNIMAAVLVAKTLEFDLEKTIASIQNVKPIAHRLEFKKIDNQTLIIDDAFNANVDGVKEAVNILSKYDGYRRILITPGIIDLGELGFELNQQVAKDISGKIDDFYMVGEYNRNAYESVLKQEKVNYNFVDNFLDGYHHAMGIDEKKVILICNDLPDKFN